MQKIQPSKSGIDLPIVWIIGSLLRFIKWKYPIRKCSVLVVLTIWFFIWGICPSDNSSPKAQAREMADTRHGHPYEMDHTHHSSKGTEHSCSGSIVYNSDNSNLGLVFSHTTSVLIPPIDTDSDNLSKVDEFQKLLFERNSLPKLISQYYHLYSVYRI